MSQRTTTHTIISGLLGIAAGWGIATATALTFKEYSTVRSVAAIAACVGVGGYAASQALLKRGEISQNDVNKVVLNQLRLKLSDTQISSSDAENLSQVIALYANTIETQSAVQETTLTSLLR